MPQVTAKWIERFATHLIQLQPGLCPLDAVRNATCAHPEASGLTPEDAAEIYLAAAHSPAEPGATE
jgi:hypothetical protein